MNKYNFILLYCLVSISAIAQTEYKIETNNLGKDERFEKYQITMPLFWLQGDTIKTLSFENMRKAKDIRIIKPKGYSNYAYGFLFFTGKQDNLNPGFTSVLIGGPQTKHPHIFIDHNHNYDFTDDERLTLPYYYEPGKLLELKNDLSPQGSLQILLTKNNLFGKYEFKKQMDDYFDFFYKDRKFIGTEHCYREQRYVTRYGIANIGNDSFKIALFDANSNGKYDDIDTDKVVVSNYNDTIFDTNSDLYSTKISKDKNQMFFEKNGFVYEILEINPTGQFIRFKPGSSDLLFGKIKTGKKIKKFVFTKADGKKQKIKHLRKYNVFMYFTSESAQNFEKDTALVRVIAQTDTSHLKVILFLYVNKSYELRMFDSQSKPNYIVALGSKELSKKLGIRGLPQSLWLGKRRKVKAYGIRPNRFLGEYSKN